MSEAFESAELALDSEAGAFAAFQKALPNVGHGTRKDRYKDKGFIDSAGAPLNSDHVPEVVLAKQQIGRSAGGRRRSVDFFAERAAVRVDRSGWSWLPRDERR